MSHAGSPLDVGFSAPIGMWRSPADQAGICQLVRAKAETKAFQNDAKILPYTESWKWQFVRHCDCLSATAAELSHKIHEPECNTYAECAQDDPRCVRVFGKLTVFGRRAEGMTDDKR